MLESYNLNDYIGKEGRWLFNRVTEQRGVGRWMTKQGKVKQLGPMGDPAGRSILHTPEGWITKTKVVNK